jgi:hypothetical protein
LPGSANKIAPFFGEGGMSNTGGVSSVQLAVTPWILSRSSPGDSSPVSITLLSP